MKLPKIDVKKIPHLDKLTGLYGSMMYGAYVLASDDTTITMMVYTYNRTMKH